MHIYRREPSALAPTLFVKQGGATCVCVCAGAGGSPHPSSGFSQARLVWVHAPGPANMALLFGSNAPFKKGDPKVRGVSLRRRAPRD